MFNMDCTIEYVVVKGNGFDGFFGEMVCVVAWQGNNGDRDAA
jgi:hypothetical protein